MTDGKNAYHVKWPWTLIPLECVDEWIEYLRSLIGPGHPLYGKEIFAGIRRCDDIEMVLFDNDTDDTYAFVNFEEKKRYKSRLMPKAEVFHSWEEVKKRLEDDHQEAMRKIKEK